VACTHGGSCYTWGAGGSGQLGRGSRKDCRAPALVESLGREKVDRVAAGRAHSLATTVGGLTFAWGDHESGQCGLGASAPGVVLRPQALFSLLDHAPLRCLDAGAAHSAFVSATGRLFTCGDGSYGQLGFPVDGRGRAQQQPPPPGAPGTLASSRGGSGGGEALGGADGGVVAEATIDEPRAVPLHHRTVSVACGAWHTIVLLKSAALSPEPSSTSTSFGGGGLSGEEASPSQQLESRSAAATAGRSHDNSPSTPPNQPPFASHLDPLGSLEPLASPLATASSLSDTNTPPSNTRMSTPLSSTNIPLGGGEGGGARSGEEPQPSPPLRSTMDALAGAAAADFAGLVAADTRAGGSASTGSRGASSSDAPGHDAPSASPRSTSTPQQPEPEHGPDDATEDPGATEAVVWPAGDPLSGGNVVAVD
jgi:hypothetical protein